jgi:hypothetical protein
MRVRARACVPVSMRDGTLELHVYVHPSSVLPAVRTPAVMISLLQASLPV